MHSMVMYNVKVVPKLVDYVQYAATIIYVTNFMREGQVLCFGVQPKNLDSITLPKVFVKLEIQISISAISRDHMNFMGLLAQIACKSVSMALNST